MCIDSHKSKMFYSKRRAIIYPLDVPDTVEYSVYRANLEYGSKRNLGKIAVLELGCGTGRYFHLLSNVSTLVGVDISSAMLERANENLQTMSALSGCTRLINSDFVNLQLHELFDFIYSIGTLGEYCKFNSEIISKIIGWLKPSGFLFFTIVDAESYKEEIIRNSTASEYVSRIQELDIRSYLVDDILTKVDVVSMQNSLEVRVPFLDHKFVELTLKIPSRYKMHNHEQKFIFKKALSPYLPASVLRHKKQGFSVPFNLWFKKDLKEYVDDRFLAAHSRLSDYLNMDYVRNVVNDHRSGGRDFNTKIWSILFFDAWLYRFGIY